MRDVTICIPAYKSSEFIGGTLEAIRQQSYPGFRALISLDGPDAATESICREFARSDARFELVVQAERLGWLGNTNALFDRVGTEFFCIMPHDDWIAPCYLETLRDAALAHPDTLVVYCDMERHGSRRQDIRSTPGLDGPFYDRIMALLSAPTEAVAWRGLTRSAVLSDGRRMVGNVFDSYNCHLLWVLGLLCLAPFHHVPLPLYRQWERISDTSVTTGWRLWPAERLYAAMAEHTLQCMQTVSVEGEADASDRQGLIVLLLLRLLAHPRAVNSFKAGKAPPMDRYLIRAAELLGRVHMLPFMDTGTPDRLRQDPGLWQFMAKLRVKDAAEALAVGDLTAAAVAVDAALALDPDCGDAHLRKAAVLRRQHRIDEARSEIEQAANRMPANVHVHVERANILEASGDLNAALLAAGEAVSLDPAYASAHYRLSTLLAAVGRKAEAIASAARAVAADPQQEKFRRHYERLRYAERQPARNEQGRISPA